MYTSTRDQGVTAASVLRARHVWGGWTTDGRCMSRETRGAPARPWLSVAFRDVAFPDDGSAYTFAAGDGGLVGRVDVATGLVYTDGYVPPIDVRIC
jgi:hypothetical protein